MYFRNVLECIAALYGDPEFARHLVYAPERHYSDPDMQNRVYGELHTGEWWWETQVELDHI